MKLAFAPEAEEQADECDRWWREHRAAKDIFARELAATRTLLREAPNIGSMYTASTACPSGACCCGRREHTSTTRWTRTPSW